MHTKESKTTRSQRHHDTNQSALRPLRLWIIKSSVLFCFPVAITKPINEKHRESRNGPFVSHFQLRVLLQGKSGQEPEAEIMGEHYFLAFSEAHGQPALLYSLGPPAAHSGLGSTTAIVNQDNLSQTWPI